MCSYSEGRTAERLRTEGALYVSFSAQPTVDQLDLTRDDDIRRGLRMAYPSFETTGGEDALLRTFKSRPFSVAKRYFLNVWTEGDEDQWLPEGRWAQLLDLERPVPRKASCHVGFDGSVSGDCTAIVVVMVDEDNKRPHVVEEHVWYPRGQALLRGDVEAALESVFDRFKVLTLTCGPSYWHEDVDRWTQRWGNGVPKGATAESSKIRHDQKIRYESRVLKVPTSGNKYGVGCDALFTAVIDESITHADLSELARHLTHARVRPATMLSEFATVQQGTRERPVDAVTACALALYGRHSWRPPPVPHAYLW